MFGKRSLTIKSLRRKNFKPSEFIASETARKRFIDNKVYDIQVLINLNRLADSLQFIRDHLNCPIFITNAYRSPKLNKAVGGSRTSDHPKGNCADIQSTYGNPKELGYRIIELCNKFNIEFDQILIEDKCVHISVKERGNNRNETAYWLSDKDGTMIKEII